MCLKYHNWEGGSSRLADQKEVVLVGETSNLFLRDSRLNDE